MQEVQQNTITMPPGLEFLARGRTEPFMSAIGPSVAPESVPSGTHGAPNTSSSKDDVTSSQALCQRLADEVRQAVALDLDVKVAERLECVWEQGQQAARKFLAESRRYQEELSTQVEDFRQRQAALELENVQLQQLLNATLGQLAAWGSGDMNSPAGDLANICKVAAPVPATSPDGSTTASVGSFSLDNSPAPIASEQSSSSGASDGVWESRSMTKPLPDVPAFPFESATPQAATTPSPLSLVSALGIVDPDMTPQAGASFPESFSDSFYAGLGVAGGYPDASYGEVFAPFSADYCPEVFSPYPVTAVDYATEAEPDHDADGFIFSVALRKAGEGIGFGLATSQAGGVLWIDGVLPGGAAEAWNRQCGSSGAAEKVLLTGDAIVSVNGVADNSEDMKLEFDTKQLLRLMVVRNDGPRSTPPQHVAAVTERSSTLRADASEFVPTGVAACVAY